MSVDLPGLGAEFKIPIFMVQGAEDLHARPEMAKAYFDSIKVAEGILFWRPALAMNLPSLSWTGFTKSCSSK
jgi:hypothetical protein